MHFKTTCMHHVLELVVCVCVCTGNQTFIFCADNDAPIGVMVSLVMFVVVIFVISLFI